MKSYKPEDIRVVGIFGHRGSGKTSLAEAMLFTAGINKRLGSVDAGTPTLELDELARERHATMAANVGHLEWNDGRIHLLDTPGDGNFWGATHRAMKVVDASLLTVSAIDGIEPMTSRAVRGLDEGNVPFAVVVTKLDKLTAGHGDFESVVTEVKAELSTDAVAVALPVMRDGTFVGVVSLLDKRAYLVDGTAVETCAIPDDMVDAAAGARDFLFDAVAAADDDLAERYLEEGELTDDELSAGLRAAVCAGDLVPIVPAMPTSTVGSHVVLDLIRSAFPSPRDRPAIAGFKSNAMEVVVEREPDPNGPLVVQVFRTHHDAFAGTVSFGRIWSGTLHASADLYNSTRDAADRPSHLFFAQGGTRNGSEVKEATVGDIVVLTKLKSAATGDTLTDKQEPTYLPEIEEPEALLTFGISPTEQKSEDKLAAMVHRLVGEDPSLRFERDPETAEMLLGGLGQAHVDLVIERLRRAAIEVHLEAPRVHYRETIRAAVKGIEGKHRKQSGGHGQFAVCLINVEPLPRGSGVQFESKIVGGSIPRNYIPSVEHGVRDAMKRGPLSGNPVVDLKVSLYDGKFHRVDSSDMAFQMAARKAMRAAFLEQKARPVLLEPYMELDIVCPADHVGEVMGDLNSRRARVHDMTTEGKRGRINASVPMAEILRYANVLESLTSGRGAFHMKFDRYEEAPPMVQQQVVTAYAGGEDHADD